MRVDEHTIDLAGSPVFYRSAGALADPVLYLHGVPTSSEDWTAFLERTGGVAPDLIGFGRSGKGGHLDYSPAGYADFIEALLDHLELERVRLVVHDWGAAGGVTFAARDPERILSIVIINAVALFPGAPAALPARIWRRPLIGELAMGAMPRWLFARALRRGAVSDQAFSQARLDAIWEQFDQGTQRAILTLHRRADAAFLAHSAGALLTLSMPALVAWGERDPWLPAEIGETYADRLPDARLERLAGAGHWPWLDHPGLVERVAAFLESSP